MLFRSKHEKIKDIFNGVSTYTSPEGELLMHLDEFATAIEQLDEPAVSEEIYTEGDYIRDAIGVVIDRTRFHDVRIEHILKQKEQLTDELVKVFQSLNVQGEEKQEALSWVNENVVCLPETGFELSVILKQYMSSELPPQEK